MEAGSKAWRDAWNAGDAAGVAALYADDAMVAPPGVEPVNGRAAVQAFWQASIDGHDGEHLDHGQYVVVWKKTDAGRRIVRDVFNSSMM